ncbi:transposase family protein [Spirosoma arcticum]
MLQLQLITLYDYVCRCYDTNLALHFQRQSNNDQPDFTDQELMTIYLFGIIQRRFTMQDTYDYIQQHWAGWFPQLPSYQAFKKQINPIGWHFEPVVDALTTSLQDWPTLTDVRLTDSLPIILSKRPNSARVARQIANKGYCPTKQLYHHGFKLHLVGVDRLGTMPLPERMQLSKASVHDLTALRQ